VLPDGVPVMEDFYQRSRYWPADSQERFRILRGG